MKTRTLTTTTVNRLMASLFLLICMVFIIYEVRQKPRVFVLHSYHESYSWSEEVTEGIEQVLQNKPYSIRWHYMDTKRHPEADFKARATKNAQKIIDQWQPHVVIAIADNAQHTMQPYINHPDISIVFGGMFADPSDYGYDKSAKNVTGIQERWPLDVIKSGLETMFIQPPEIPMNEQSASKKPARQSPLKVMHIGDQSTTGNIIASEILTHDWGAAMETTSVSVGHFDAWKDAIIHANKVSDIVIFSLYHTLYRYPQGKLPHGVTSNEVILPEEVMEWTQANLQKPGVGGWGFYVEHGGMMAIGVSAYEQGTEPARLAMQIIDGKQSPSDLPIKQSKQFLIYLREASLNTHRIKVPRIYEAFARANNNYY